MAAPVLANRVVVFVNKIGTDDAGYNPVGRPWSRLTIAAALADLLANYPAGTIAEPTELTLGPGTYTVTTDLAIPPNVFITGSGDADSAINTVIQLVGADIILDPDWADGACIGGLANLVIRGEGGVIDFTVPVPGAGNPARRPSLENVTTDVDLVNLEATSTGDIFNVDHLTHDGNLTNNFTVTGAAIRINNTVSRATNTVGSKAGFAGTALLTANYFATIALSQVATALTVLADVLSLATVGTLSLVGAPAITRITDANGLGYTPAIPANWPVGTDTVQEALDAIASGGSPVTTPGITVTQVAYGGTTANTIKGEAAFTYTEGTNTLKVDAITSNAATNLALSPAGGGAGNITILGTTPTISWGGDTPISRISAGMLNLDGAANTSLFLSEASVTTGRIASIGNVLTLRGDAAANVVLQTNATTAQTWTSAQNSTLVGSLTTSQTGGLIGTNTNNNANAGSVGQTVSALVAVGAAVPLTTATAANVTSISLTAGDWDVEGNVNFTEAVATVTARAAGISSTTATLPTDGSEGGDGAQTVVVSAINTITLPVKRISLSATTTIFLVASATFSAGTVGGFGAIVARRRR